MKSKIKSPLNIKAGAYATVEIGGEHYDGYLKDIENLTDTVAEAYVSIVCDKPLFGKAEAVVYGQIAKNVVFIPKECIFKNKKGENAVMIAKEGYVIERKIITGDMENPTGIQVKSGLFPDEKIVKNYENLKSGDRYNENY